MPTMNEKPLQHAFVMKAGKKIPIKLRAISPEELRARRDAELVEAERQEQEQQKEEAKRQASPKTEPKA